MNERQLQVYLSEMLHQRQISHIAAGYLNVALNNQDEDVGSSVARHFAAAQMILTAAAQVSKLLFADTRRDWTPERTAYAYARASALRKIVDPPRILQRRAVRNSVEHLDARLDDAYFADEHANIVDGNVTPKGMIVVQGATWLRHLDPASLEYSALDDAVSLQELVNAIEHVAQRAEAWLAARRP